MKRKVALAIAGVGFGIILAVAVGTWYINNAIYESEKKLQTTLLRHYVDEHLKPGELEIILIASSATVPDGSLEGFDRYFDVLPKQVSERLGYYGTGVRYAHPDYIVPTYAPFEGPREANVFPITPTRNTIFVIEDKAIEERMENPEFQAFFREAAESHSSFVALGENSIVLKDLVKRAGVSGTDYVSGNPRIFAFKYTDNGAVLYEGGPPIHHVESGEDFDWALFMLKFAREETDLARQIVYSANRA